MVHCSDWPRVGTHHCLIFRQLIAACRPPSVGSWAASTRIGKADTPKAFHINLCLHDMLLRLSCALLPGPLSRCSGACHPAEALRPLADLQACTLLYVSFPGPPLAVLLVLKNMLGPL